MRDGVIFSSVLHVVVVLVVVFGLPSFVEPFPIDTTIPVELVVFDPDEAKVQPEPEPEEPKAEEEAADPKPPPTKATPLPQPKPPPTLVAEAVPEPLAAPSEEEEAPPEPEVVPEAPPEKVEEVKEEEPPAKAPPAPKRKPEPKTQVAEKVEKKVEKKEEAPKPDALTSILKNVEKLKEEPKQVRDSTAQAPQQGQFAAASVFEQREIVQIIQAKMQSCWRVEPGARDAANLIVEIRLRLNQDGSVRDAEIVDMNRFLSDPFYQTAAENARRAILKCSPFGELPLRKYNLWREMSLKFDPRKMFGIL